MGSKRWIKVWAKRVITLRLLAASSFRRWKLTRRGAAIHPLAVIGEATFRGRLDYLSIGPGSFIGRSQVMLHAEVRIGANVCVNDGTTLLTASHDVHAPDWPQHSDPIVIEDFCWIATGACLLPGTTLRRGSVAAAYSVCRGEIPPLAVVAGNPAHSVTKRRIAEFDYSPTRYLAFMDAWLG